MITSYLTRTFAKQKVTKVHSGEKVNLFSKLSINPRIDENPDKVQQLVERCQFCLPKTQGSVQVSQHKTAEQRSKTRQNNTGSHLNPAVNLSEQQLLSLQKLPNLERNLLSTQALPNTNEGSVNLNQKKSGMLKAASQNANSVFNNSIVAPVLEEDKNIFKSNLTITKPDKSDTKSYSNFDVLENLNRKNQPNQCQCLYAMQNFSATRLGLTYLCYIRFPDGTNSLLKAENFWNVTPENPVSLNILLKNPRVKLNESLGLVLVIKNTLAQEIDLQVTENSFKFKYSLEDKNFGSLILENKIARNIYINAMSQDSISFFFMPIKCGMVELETVSFFDQKNNKELIFDCQYKILIN